MNLSELKYARDVNGNILDRSMYPHVFHCVVANAVQNMGLMADVQISRRMPYGEGDASGLVVSVLFDHIEMYDYEYPDMGLMWVFRDHLDPSVNVIQSRDAYPSHPHMDGFYMCSDGYNLGKATKLIESGEPEAGIAHAIMVMGTNSGHTLPGFECLGCGKHSSSSQRSCGVCGATPLCQNCTRHDPVIGNVCSRCHPVTFILDDGSKRIFSPRIFKMRPDQALCKSCGRAVGITSEDAGKSTHYCHSCSVRHTGRRCKVMDVYYPDYYFAKRGRGREHVSIIAKAMGGSFWESKAKDFNKIDTVDLGNSKVTLWEDRSG